MRLTDSVFTAIFLIFFVAVAALGIWMTFAAPCWVFQWSPHHEIPARCLAEFIR